MDDSGRLRRLKYGRNGFGFYVKGKHRPSIDFQIVNRIDKNLCACPISFVINRGSRNSIELHTCAYERKWRNLLTISHAHLGALITTNHSKHQSSIVNRSKANCAFYFDPLRKAQLLWIRPRRQRLWRWHRYRAEQLKMWIFYTNVRRRKFAMHHDMDTCSQASY